MSAIASVRPVRTIDHRLAGVGVCFAGAVIVHNADHVRRGADAVPTDVFWTGTLAIALEVGVVAAIALGHRLAPLLAAAAGFGLAAGYVTVHFLPARSWLSDSFTSGAGVSPLSWFAASLELVAALALGAAGATAWARPERDRRDRARTQMLVVAAVFALSQAVTLTASFAQR